MLKDYLKKLKNCQQTILSKESTLKPFVEKCEVTPGNAQLYLNYLVARKTASWDTISKKKQYLEEFLMDSGIKSSIT
jgi:arginyl-tRNA--protein-N-Asp/Glu arginylyltransferase